MKNPYKKYYLITLIIAILLYLTLNYTLSHSSKTSHLEVYKPEVSEPEVYKPEATNIIKLLHKNNKDNSHPRLMATSKDFQKIKTEISKDKTMKEKYNYIKIQADVMLNEKPVKYELPDNVILLSISRKVLHRIQTLAFIYQISGQKIYADRAWLELQTISDANPDRKNFAFPDWHSSHFLDTAEMTNAAAIGYDWLYDYLSGEQKSIIRNAILVKGLNEALKFYHTQKDWVVSNSNWNGVCNGGIGLGALAIGDEGGNFERTSGEILEYAIKSLPNMLNQYDSDGGWYEGVAYWDYATTYCAYFISALDSSLGTDYGLSQIPKFSSSGDFPIYLTGTNGTFNFADADPSKLKSPVLLWLGSKFKKNDYILYYNKVATKKDITVMYFIWYNKSIGVSKPSIQDKYFRGTEVAALHTSLLESTDSFVGFKAGENNLNHGDLDIGTFVYDSLGVRWFCDLGSENYNLPGYWDMALTGKRWQYYRKRAEGHNTLVINSGLKPDQNIYAKTKIETFKSDAKKAFAIADITNAYKNDALSIKRGVILFKNNGSMLVQDEITTKKPSDIWWFAHTQAIIQISSDKKSALLFNNGKTLKVSILSPVYAYFNEMKAVPMATSPNPLNQTYNNLEKLSIHLNNVQNTTISVLMSPLIPNKTESLESLQVIKLENWSKTN